MVEKKTSGRALGMEKEKKILSIQELAFRELGRRADLPLHFRVIRAMVRGDSFPAAETAPEVRSQDPGQRRVLDRAARQRRINRQLEALENDNFQDDPHAGLPQLGKRLPQFDDDADTGKKKKKTRGDHFKLRFRKNFQALLEEQNLSVAEGPNYLTACAGPPSRPQRPFCAVCGFPSPYTCVSCGARYCTVRCLGTHQETRCLKWTV
ncbi:zinc finger HIT domain-containing protein 1 isoform X1 [Phocoena sinus]|uniref:zinc finger HIT domain-containing protein 1 isoform X1 n=1 Tax=Phocoena sinus TaxID=42100 RepID=UPI0013C4C172|nr:zinc finger HIT domain-containing protein 1 isoform X1 [Phocoena sinus]